MTTSQSVSKVLIIAQKTLIFGDLPSDKAESPVTVPEEEQINEPEEMKSSEIALRASVTTD